MSLSMPRGNNSKGFAKSPNGHSQRLDMGCNTSLSPRYRVPKTIAEPPSPRQMPRFDLSPRHDRDLIYSQEREHKNKYSVLKSAAAPIANTRPADGERVVNPPKGIHLRGELGTNSTIQQLPFGLVQIHRDVMTMPATKDVRRGIKCFLRLCGSMSTGLDAKAAAEAQLCNSAIKFKAMNIGKCLIWPQFS
jgi:hypothetical protein